MARRSVAEKRRKQILMGLFLAANERGLLECSLADVARHAGVSKGILHYYFESKEQMLAALVQAVEREHLPRLLASFDTIDDPVERLRTFIWFPLKGWDTSRRPLARLWIEMWGLAGQYPAIEAFIRKLQHDLRALLARCIEDGMQRGSFSAISDSERAAALVLACMEGLILQWRFNPEETNFKGQLAALEHILVADVPLTDAEPSMEPTSVLR